MPIHKSAISIKMLGDHLTALVEAGGYESEREVIRDALEALVEANPELRLEMALTLWKQKKITLSRAVEISQSDHETFKQEIAKRGLYIEIDMDVEEMKKEAEFFPQYRPMSQENGKAFWNAIRGIGDSGDPDLAYHVKDIARGEVDPSEGWSNKVRDSDNDEN